MNAQSNYRKAEDLCVQVFENTQELPDSDLRQRLRNTAMFTLVGCSEILGAGDPDLALVACSDVHRGSLQVAALALVAGRLGHLPGAEDIARQYGEIYKDMHDWYERPRPNQPAFFN